MRSHFSSSLLVRLLDASVPAAAQPGGQDVAQRLSAWVNAFDAITLHAVHQPIVPVDAGRRSQADLAASLAAVEDQFRRVRSGLVKSLTTRDSQALQDAPAAFAPVRRRYLEQQRQMELKIGPLRSEVRRALSNASARLRQLATLDAVWEQTLSEREQHLLSSVPARLQQRFEQLRRLHAAPASPPADAPGPRQSDGWLDRFGRELREVLLAELEVRLEPVAGMIEAYRSEVNRCQ